jgi:hypothetical protein
MKSATRDAKWAPTLRAASISSLRSQAACNRASSSPKLSTKLVTLAVVSTDSPSGTLGIGAWGTGGSGASGMLGSA